MADQERRLGFGTAAVHAGEPRKKDGNALTTPIMQTATYTFADTQELRDHFERRIEREEYGRYGNPTQRIAEQKLAALEGGRGGHQAALSVSPEQEAELERFQHERVRIRKELRETRRSLDVEIEALGTRLKVINIALVPSLLALGAIFLEIVRRRRLRAGRAAAHTG